MTNIDEKLLERIKRAEREIERLKVKERPSGSSGGGVTDHGALTGLLDNDHPQYLLTSGKAADADKLDNIDSTGFVQTSGTQSVGGIKTFSSIPVLPSSNPTAANQAARKGYIDSNFVGLTGNQVITGVKTFSSLPTLPTTAPTTNQPIRKGYADATYVGLTGTETIAGVKSFSSIPVLPASNPTAVNQAVRKGYVDSNFVSSATLGTWQNWTPTVTYLGGSTDPTSTTIEHARYCQIGNMVSFSLVASIVCGSGNRTVAFVTLPITAKYSQITASCSEDIVTSTNTPRACWADNTSRMVVTLTSAMTQDGRIRISGTYEV